MAKVLLVEDEAVTAWNIECILKEAKHDVVVVKSADEAVVQAAANSPQLVLMDIYLEEGGDGIKAAEEIYRRFNIPIIYLTGYSDQVTLKRALNSHPYGYLIKPVLDMQLYTSVEMALQQHQADTQQQLVSNLYAQLHQQEVVEAELRRSLQQKETLLKEVQHRIKNNLQFIASLLRLQSHHSADPSVKLILQTVEHRLTSMALVHEYLDLYGSSNKIKVELSSYIRSLCHHIYNSLNPDPEQIHCHHLISSGITTTVKRAIACGLIVNELITNAFKHGFQGGKLGGDLTVTLSQQTNGEITLSVANTGMPLPTPLSIEDESSLGLKLMALLAEDLATTLEVKTEPRTCFSFTFAP